MDVLARDHRVVAVDLPGFGESATDGSLPYGVPFFAATLCELLDRLGIDRAARVGNSMGGQVSAYAAATRPSRVERLVLVDAAGVRTGQLRALTGGGLLTVAVAVAGGPDRATVQALIQPLLFAGPCDALDDLVDRALADLRAADAASRQEALRRSFASIVETPLTSCSPRSPARPSSCGASATRRSLCRTLRCSPRRSRPRR